MRKTERESAGDSWIGQPDDLVIGEVRVQPRLLRIFVRGQAHRLEPKTMQVLQRLARSPAQAVTRSELLDAVWPDVHVTEDVLNRSIYQLRKLFGDNPRSPRYIETIPTVGYRLLAPVEVPSRDATDESSDSTPPPAISAASRSRGRYRWTRLAAAAAIVLALGFAVATLTSYLNSADSSKSASGSGASEGPEATDPIRVAPLFPGPGHQIQPALSPDGERIAYSAISESGSWDLFVGLVSEDTTVQRTASPAIDMAPAWSNDGAQLAWLRFSDDACAIYRGPYLGDDEGRVADCPLLTQPRLAWSPDGHSLVYAAASHSGGALRLWNLDVGTGEREPLTDPPNGLGGDYFPAFSRDGAWIAFVRGTVLSASDVHLLPTGGGDVRRLTHDSLTVSGVDFSADGEHLIFLSNRAGDFGLWKVPLTGGEPEWLGHSGPALEQVTVAARHHRIAMVSANGHFELWESSIGTFEVDEKRRLAPSSRDDRNAQYSPDGRSLAWVSSRSGSPEIWIADTGGKGPVRRTRFEGPQLGTPRWSPDGRALLFEAQTVHNADIFRLYIDSDGPRAITHGNFHEVAPHWSADGLSVLFASDRSGRWQVWRLDLASERTMQITENGGFAAVESPDGSWLYYTKAERPGLWVAPTGANSEERLLVSDLEASDWRTLLAVPGGAIYARRLEWPRVEVVRVNRETGKVDVLIEELELPHFSALDLSPDRSKVLHSRIQGMDADLYLLENLL